MKRASLLCGAVIVLSLGAGRAGAQTMNGVVARMLFPPRNYEIALGDTIIPTVRVINTGTVIDSGIKVWFRYSNVTWPNNVAIYSSKISVPNLAPGDSIDLSFAAYATNSNIISELGTFNGCLTILDTVPLTTTCSSIFGIRRTPVPFFDPSDGYSKAYVGSYDIPDQAMWVSVGATVVDGEDSTWDPPPPRYPNGGIGPDSMVGPVMRIDRLDFNGNYYSGNGVGDTVTSFPINIQGQSNARFSFDFMRTGRHRYPLGWDADTLIGPAQTILDSNGNVLRAGDSLILEFEKSSGPATNPGPNDWNEIAAIDGGRDFEYKSFLMSPDSNGWQITVNGITTHLKDTTNYATDNFRFRLRLKANNNGSSHPVGDADAWYVDNVMLTIPLVNGFETDWVKIITPYTKVPVSQAIFPVYRHLLNIVYPIDYPIPLYELIIAPNGDTVYSDTTYVNNVQDGQDTVIRCKDWDARSVAGMPGAFTALAFGGNSFSEPSNILSTYSKFYLNVDNVADRGIQEFAYDDAGLDPGVNTGNDIPKLIGIPSAGIGFNNATGSFAMKFQLVREDTFYGVRAYFGGASQAPDSIQISLLNGDSNSSTPLDTVVQPGIQSTLVMQRGPYLNQLSIYYFPIPITLEPGIYWVSVSQLTKNNMELGGDILRGGGDLVQANNTAPKINAIYGSQSPGTPWYGTQWGSGPGDNNGDVSCSFAVETPAGSGNWRPMMPDSGLWPVMDSSYPLNWHFPLNPNGYSPDTLPWVGLGTYFPMIRAVFAGNPPSGVKTSPVITNFGLESNFPDPFDPTSTSTTITFTLDTRSPTTLTVCNILGEVVKTLLNANVSAGSHSVSWNGRDENGAVVPAGTYLVTLLSSERHATTKMIVTE